METVEGSTRKRLVVCCDGTWNRPDKDDVTNIEKIARTVETDLRQTEGVQQLVLYVSGVGSGSYAADRILGGAFGLGLSANIVNAYRFLALNYKPGDEVFVFGFSRGAYTARSLCGMIGRVGLLTREALVADQLDEAVKRYKAGADGADAFEVSPADFKTRYCHPDATVRLLGVFDTVGALGVPGAVRRKHQFHDVRLGSTVTWARQALAVDERRLKFEPCLWEATDDARAADEKSGRVEQVWFSGVHSDVGGGYRETGLSDTTLLWMTDEAKALGLVFDQRLLDVYVDSGGPGRPHNSLSTAFRVLNLASGARMRLTGKTRGFVRGWRRLDPPTDPTSGRAVGVKIATFTAEDYRQHPELRHAGMAEFAGQTDGFTGYELEVVRLPGATHRGAGATPPP
jgi:uncharacterized protein (DUF2235 family)